MPLRQNVYIKGDPTDEKSLKLTEGLIKRLFTLKEGVVRELTINSVINEGYTTQTGDFEISKDMQELINLGLISEEEVKKSAVGAVTVFPLSTVIADTVVPPLLSNVTV